MNRNPVFGGASWTRGNQGRPEGVDVIHAGDLGKNIGKKRKEERFLSIHTGVKLKIKIDERWKQRNLNVINGIRFQNHEGI